MHSHLVGNLDSVGDKKQSMGHMFTGVVTRKVNKPNEICTEDQPQLFTIHTGCFDFLNPVGCDCHEWGAVRIGPSVCRE